ncbi:MAG: CfrBI family restriction endonuclease [Anaerolineae bacterium]
MAEIQVSLIDLMPGEARDPLSLSGSDLIQHIGWDVVRGVVYDVLTGRNLRDSTEMFTRRRLALLNASLVNLFLKGTDLSADFVKQLPDLATVTLQQKRLRKAKRWLAQWMLGLNDKAFQNVLRDKPEALDAYKERYIAICQEAIANCETEYGPLSGHLELSTGAKARLNWTFFVYLLTAAGARTLAIRGSEKSTYGKLFERLVLGSLLSILGFEMVSPEQPEKLERVFWLSSRGARRESDATLLYEAGKGVRFDIGFIGRGNPEISLDKVSRFERELQFGRSRWYMATVILVDRIGRKSRIVRLAQEIGGTIIQMSMGYWPRQVVQVLHQEFGIGVCLLHCFPRDPQTGMHCRYWF